MYLDFNSPSYTFQVKHVHKIFELEPEFVIQREHEMYLFLLFVFLCLAISVLSDVDYPSEKRACHSCNDCFISHKLGSAVL